MSDSEIIEKIRGDDYTASYVDSPEVRDAVFNRVLDYFKKHESFCAESICQSDEPIMEGYIVMADIAEDIIKFNVDWDDD